MRRSLFILGAILVAFVYSLFPPIQRPTLTTADKEYWVSQIVQAPTNKGAPISEEEAEDYVLQAQEIAQNTFSHDRAKCLEFRNQMLQIFVDTAGSDVVIIHNSGGWGRTPYYADKQWGPVEKEIKAILEGRGYTSTIVSYVRTHDDFFGIAKELQELLLCFPDKAKEQAEIVRFLVKNRPNMTVMVTGLSQGGAYSNQVLKLLDSDEQVCGIAAGVPFYYSEANTPRALILDSNGAQPDALKDGDVPALLGSIVSAYVRWLWHGLDGGPLGVGAHYNPPGHHYRWSAPGVSGPITDFVESNFSEKTP